MKRLFIFLLVLGLAVPCFATDYHELTLLPNGATLDDDNPAGLSVVESTGTATPRFFVADFDDGDDDAIYWTFTLPSTTAAGNWILQVNSYSDEDVDENVVWAAQVSATSDDDTDNIGEQSADTVNTVTENYNKGEAYALCIAEMTISNTDSAAAGDTVTIKFYRDGDNGSDNHTNEVYLLPCLLKVPRS